MIYWYKDMYMDEKVKKNPDKCKKKILKRRPWKKNYFAIILATNKENLFEIIETRQLFFRRYSYIDMYVLGLTSKKEEAVNMLPAILKDNMDENGHIKVRENLSEENGKWQSF